MPHDRSLRLRTHALSLVPSSVAALVAVSAFRVLRAARCGSPVPDGGAIVDDSSTDAAPIDFGDVVSPDAADAGHCEA